MEENQLDLDLKISERAKQNLLDAAKWGNFLAIVSFAFLAIMVLIVIISKGTMSMYETGGYNRATATGEVFGSVFAMFLMLFLYGYPIFMLYNYSKKLKIAILNLDNNSLEEAFDTQKKMYKFIGIVTIIFVSIFFLAFLFSLSKY